MPPRAHSRRLRLAIVGVSVAMLAVLGGTLPTAAAASSKVAPTVADAVEVPAFPDPSAGPSGCRTTSDYYPWGETAVREWTPTATDNLAPGNGHPFSARLIQAYNRDTGISAEISILEDASGCRTAYPTNSFSDDDQAYVAAMRAEHRPSVDPSSYRTVYDPNLASEEQVQDGTVLSYETQHFAILYGANTDAFSYQWQADRNINWNEGIERLGQWMEESYETIRDVTGAPMPGHNSDDKQRINIYICGTGMPWQGGDLQDCGASANAGGMYVSAVYILDGSSTMTHELAHVLQGLTGGFAGGLPGAGNAWEGHANWVSASTGTYFNIWYYQNLENGPTWQTNYYGFFPLLLQIAENEATKPYLWRAWQENLRDSDQQTQEELLETLVRLGREDGVYPLGFASFADELGWYGARLAANDFVQGRVFRDTTSYHQEASRYVGLVPTDEVDTFTSSPERTLWQFGSHLIPLQPDADTVSVSVEGVATTDSAAWRYSLVHVDENGSPTYSPLGADDASRTGTTVTLDTTAPGKYFLAVTATPYELQRIGGEERPLNATEFPYSVHLSGARPSLPGTGTCLGPYLAPDAANLNWKTNGNFAWDQACTHIGPRVSIINNPVNTTVTDDQPATFTASATGSDATALQWQSAPSGSTRWQDLPDERAEMLTLHAGQEDGLRVRLVATDDAGTKVASSSAVLTVAATEQVPPAAEPTTQPALTPVAPAGGVLQPRVVTAKAMLDAPGELAVTGLNGALVWTLTLGAIFVLVAGSAISLHRRHRGRGIR